MSKVRSLTRSGTVGVNPRTTQSHQSGLPAVCTAMGQPISSIISQAFLLSAPPWVSPSPPSSVRPSCCLHRHGSAHLHHQSGILLSAPPWVSPSPSSVRNPAVCTAMGQPISSIISQAFLLSAPPWVSPSPSSVRNPAVCTAMGQPISSIISQAFLLSAPPWVSPSPPSSCCSYTLPLGHQNDEDSRKT